MTRGIGSFGLGVPTMRYLKGALRSSVWTIDSVKSDLRFELVDLRLNSFQAISENSSFQGRSLRSFVALALIAAFGEK